MLLASEAQGAALQEAREGWGAARGLPIWGWPRADAQDEPMMRADDADAGQGA
jgi:hypothetical protein